MCGVFQGQISVEYKIYSKTPRVVLYQTKTGDDFVLDMETNMVQPFHGSDSIARLNEPR